MTGQVDYIPSPGCGSTFVKFLLTIIILISFGSLYLAGIYTYNYRIYSNYHKTTCYYDNGTINTYKEILTNVFEIDVMESNDITNTTYKISYPLPPLWANMKSSEDVNKTLERLITSENFSCLLDDTSGVLENYNIDHIIILYVIGICTLLFIISFCVFRYLHLKGKIKSKNYKDFKETRSIC